MTPRQEKFCLEYASCGNARQSYLKAGYKGGNDATTDVNASRLLKNDKVQQRLRELSEQAANEKIADVQELSERLTNVVRGNTTEQVVIQEWTGKGKSRTRVIEKHPSEQTRLKASEQLLKIYGAFNQKVNIEATIPVVISGENELED